MRMTSGMNGIASSRSAASTPQAMSTARIRCPRCGRGTLAHGMSCGSGRGRKSSYGAMGGA